MDRERERERERERADCLLWISCYSMAEGYNYKDLKDTIRPSVFNFRTQKVGLEPPHL